jgi:Raf kinase inhibitor-like YbhB/YbcL family protein
MMEANAIVRCPGFESGGPDSRYLPVASHAIHNSLIVDYETTPSFAPGSGDDVQGVDTPDPGRGAAGDQGGGPLQVLFPGAAHEATKEVFRMKRIPVFITALLVLTVVCAVLLADDKKKEGTRMQLTVTSSAFEEGAMIPQDYTCDGRDKSPGLSWSRGPDGTKSYAVIADDPDAPVGTWVHWVVYDIPPDVTSLAEGEGNGKKLDCGASHGVNDFRRHGYGGPCPPGGTHRYFFKVYAVDTVTGRGPGISKKELLGLLEGHVLAEGTLMGRYSRR